MKQKLSKAETIQNFVSSTIVRIKSKLTKPAEEVSGNVPVATPNRLEYILKAVMKWQG